MKKIVNVSAAIAIVLGLTGGATLPATGAPTRIFILAGQSNMLGQGNMIPVTTQGTLEYIVANDPGTNYQFLVDGTGAWVEREDVWIKDQYGSYGGLTSGYGSDSTTVGPELGFGHAAGDQYENQVLIVKAAWGGKSLAVDFRPPSSGGTTGSYYNEVLRLVNDAIANLSTYFPGYNAAEGYEIAGFGWHQGWNDRVTPAYSAEYQTNMVNFIKDMRSDLAVPDLPFVIATTGMDGGSAYSEVELAQLAMANPLTYPEFVGNVAVVDTRIDYDGMEFWQPVEFSPADQGYHWNRNAKTYVNIGLAIGDAMSALSPGRCPSRLRAVGGPGGITLTWQNGSETPTSVQVLRNGVEIAAAAPSTPATYLDTAALPGLHHYEFAFTMPVDPCDPLTVTFNGGITDLAAFRSPGGIDLTWINTMAYAGIEVRRNGTLLEASLAGTTTTYTDTSPPPGGLVTYTVVPTNGSAAPTEVQINLDGPPAGNALIYEPFDYPTGGLNLQSGNAEVGLEGQWSASSTALIAAGTLTYGTLSTGGNSIGGLSGSQNNFGGARTIRAAALAANGLLDDGATLWFSLIMGVDVEANRTNSRLAFSLANSTFNTGNYDYWIVDEGAQLGSGLGVSLIQGKPTASQFRDLGSGDGTAGNVLGSFTGSQMANGEHGLIVGKITWGENPSDPDTIELYQPATNLFLPAAPISALSVTVDQTVYDTVTWARGDMVTMDEIRFGVSYNDVVAADIGTDPDTEPPTPDPMSFASAPTALGATSISMTATTAADVLTPGVEYYFTCTAGGGNDSGWQVSPNYTDTGLTQNSTYSYTVKARDTSSAHNETAPSPAAHATTMHDPNVIPFDEPFEDRSLEPLDGQFGWQAQDVIVQSSVTYGDSSQAASLTQRDARAVHTFGDGQTRVWTDLQLRPVFAAGEPTPETDATVALYVSTNGHVMAYNGKLVVDTRARVSEDAWVRLTTYSDYTTRTWDLFVNKIRVASGLGFYSTTITSYTELAITGAGDDQHAHMDEIGIGFALPFEPMYPPTTLMIK